MFSPPNHYITSRDQIRSGRNTIAPPLTPFRYQYSCLPTATLPPCPLHFHTYSEIHTHFPPLHLESRFDPQETRGASIHHGRSDSRKEENHSTSGKRELMIRSVYDTCRIHLGHLCCNTISVTQSIVINCCCQADAWLMLGASKLEKQL